MNYITKFEQYVQMQCLQHGVEYISSDSKFVEYGNAIKCGGYFDSTQMKLAYARKSDNWLELLAHEYCHLTQWVEKLPEWDNYIDIDGWLNHDVEWTQKEINRAIKSCIALELDNEKRTVEVIKKFKLPIDIELYVKKANAYLTFYSYIAESRRWLNAEQRAPYANKEIIKSMPSRFKREYYKLSDKNRKLFLKEGY